MTSRQAPAPTVADLQAYVLGKLGPERTAEVESFLADHPEYGPVLEATPDDEVVRHLRGAGDLFGNDTVFDKGLPPVHGPAPEHPGEDGATVGPEAEPGSPAAALAGHPRYRLLRKLGEGGMGTVYLAEHRLMHRQVALKVIRPSCLSHPQAVERFRREVRAAAGLNHPNVVTAHDAEEAGGTHFLVMEYVEGVSLDRWLAEHGPLPVAEACDCVCQAALGVQYAHEKGVVHRDLKPHNLMRTPDGTVKVLDFGVARLAREADDAGPASLTDPGAVMGTADYMAPERGQDSRTADVRADVYSLGCTLYHLLAGRPPFPRGTAVGKILQHTLDRPPSLARARADLPAGLVRVVGTMMAKRPADRYQTPAEAAAALKPFAHPAGIAPPRKRRRLPIAVAVAVLLVGAALSAAVLYRLRTNEGAVGLAPPRPALFRTFPFPAGSFADQFHFSTDNRRLVGSGLYRGGAVVYVWDIETGKTLCALTGVPRKVWHNARLLPGGKEFLLQADNSLSRWDVATGKKVGDYPPVPDGFNAAHLDLAPDGKHLALLYPGHLEQLDGRDLVFGSRIYLRELAAATPSWIEPEQPRSILCYSFRFSPDGGRLVTTDSSLTKGALRVWDVATGKVAARVPADVAFSGWTTWSADGRCLFAGYGDPKTKKSAVGTWDAATGEQLAAVEYALPRDASDGVVLAADGRWFATLHLAAGRLTVWDGRTGAEVETLTIPGLTELSPTASPDGTLLAAGNRHEVRLYRFRGPGTP